MALVLLEVLTVRRSPFYRPSWGARAVYHLVPYDFGVSGVGTRTRVHPQVASQISKKQDGE